MKWLKFLTVSEDSVSVHSTGLAEENLATADSKGVGG
jgi:hypothetical protein